jgi:methionyl-tRNA formyltransferase
MGTPEFALPALALLLERNYRVIGVVTQPDRQQGRGKTLQPPPVKVLAASFNLPVIQPERVRDAAFLETFRMLSPDMVVLAAFGQILPEEITTGPVMGCLNIHPSLLPQYRGAAPMNWTIIRGEKKTGVTIMQMVKELDAGDIILQEETSIGQDETFDQLHDRLSRLGAELLIKAIGEILAGVARPVPQDGTAATYAPRLKKEDGLIRWEDNVENIVNLIRGLSSQPGAYTFLDGKKLKIFGAKGEMTSTDDAPGTTIPDRGTGFTVAAGNGYIHLLDVQMENKKRMKAADFLRGYQLRPATVLG